MNIPHTPSKLRRVRTPPLQPWHYGAHAELNINELRQCCFYISKRFVLVANRFKASSLMRFILLTNCLSVV